MLVRESRPEREDRPRLRQAEVLKLALAHPIIARVMFISFITVGRVRRHRGDLRPVDRVPVRLGPAGDRLRLHGHRGAGASLPGQWSPARWCAATARRGADRRTGLDVDRHGVPVRRRPPGTWPWSGSPSSASGSRSASRLTALISPGAPRRPPGRGAGAEHERTWRWPGSAAQCCAGQMFSLVNPGAAFVVTAILIIPASFMALQIMKRMPRAA